MSNRLTLPLKTKWFDMIKSGEKLEEYREITPYWVRRLTVLIPDKDKEHLEAHFLSIAKHSILHGFPVFREFDEVEFTKGYPKKGDKNRRIVFKRPLIMISNCGVEKWGAIPRKWYFSIRWNQEGGDL